MYIFKRHIFLSCHKKSSFLISAEIEVFCIPMFHVQWSFCLFYYTIQSQVSLLPRKLVSCAGRCYNICYVHPSRSIMEKESSFKFQELH